jgi:hypothetical protein
MDLIIPMEVGPSNKISHNRCMNQKCEEFMSKLPVLSELVDILKSELRYREVSSDAYDKPILHPENREYFRETFDVDGLYPLFT